MSDSDTPSLGLSGRIARAFLTTQITPLLALVGLLLGVFAVLITPREEEPQINVTFANVFIPFPGAGAREVEQLVTTPAERILSEIQGVEHLYSASMPGMAAITVRFTVGRAADRCHRSPVQRAVLEPGLDAGERRCRPAADQTERHR